MQTPLSAINGIGPQRQALLLKLGVQTVEDLLQLYPHRYEDRSQVLPVEALSRHLGEKVSILATVLSEPAERRIYGGRLLTEVTVGDDSGCLTLTYFNNPYIKAKLRPGKTFNFYGPLDRRLLLHMTAPQAEQLRAGQRPGILPVYPLTGGLSQALLRGWVRQAFELAGRKQVDPLPEGLRQKYALMERGAALQAVHFPKDQQALQQGRRRLIFEELLFFQLGLGLYSRRQKERNAYPVFTIDSAFRHLQPFEPTPSQRKAVKEIQADMRGSYAMNRLLQGDVGSGKTYVAGEAAYSALSSGYQAAIMAPTEILARQHAAYIRPLFEKLGYTTGLLVGSMKPKEKSAVYTALADGGIRLVIGTHALLQKEVRFQNLGLVIADEQHRFGVRQRAALAAKGEKPHILVMSATPIPRTMALMVWGDLDLSVLEGRPAGRKEIRTYLVDSSYRARLTAFMERQMKEGGQIYIVCPLVEENEAVELKSVEALLKELQAQYGDAVDMIHGKMNASLKETAMNRFVAGRVKILISTTVIEVGINVPNATLMILQNAERFGLSQLHQLRGRVGRGEKQSFCVLISDSKNEKTLERLQYFCATTDGFAIAQKDLELRGPGDFFGDLQHGLPRMRIANCATDLELLTVSAQCARRIMQDDPLLEKDANRRMREQVECLFNQNGTAFN